MPVVETPLHTGCAPAAQAGSRAKGERADGRRRARATIAEGHGGGRSASRCRRPRQRPQRRSDGDRALRRACRALVGPSRRLPRPACAEPGPHRLCAGCARGRGPARCARRRRGAQASDRPPAPRRRLRRRADGRAYVSVGRRGGRRRRGGGQRPRGPPPCRGARARHRLPPRHGGGAGRRRRALRRRSGTRNRRACGPI